MKFNSELSSLEIFEFLKELKEWNKSFIDKVYYENKLVLRFHNSEKGKVYFVYDHPFVYLTNEINEMVCKGVGLKLKKYVHHKKIIDIFQRGNDRMIVFEFKDMLMVIELFFHGNVMIVDKNNKIIFQTNPKGGSKKETDVFLIEKKEFLPNINEFHNKLNEKQLVKGIARFVGGFYGELFCKRYGLDKNEMNFDVGDVYDKFVSFINEKPFFCIGNDYFSVRKTEDYNESYETFSEMIKNVIKREDPTIESLKKAKEMQIKRKQELMEDIENLNKIVELIYSNYQEIDELLKSLNNNKPIKELKSVKVKGIDKKNKKVKIEFIS